MQHGVARGPERHRRIAGRQGDVQACGVGPRLAAPGHRHHLQPFEHADPRHRGAPRFHRDAADRLVQRPGIALVGRGVPHVRPRAVEVGQALHAPLGLALLGDVGAQQRQALHRAIGAAQQLQLPLHVAQPAAPGGQGRDQRPGHRQACQAGPAGIGQRGHGATRPPLRPPRGPQRRQRPSQALLEGGVAPAQHAVRAQQGRQQPGPVEQLDPGAGQGGIQVVHGRGCPGIRASMP